MKKQHIILVEADKIYLSKLLSKGVQKIRVQKRALCLQMLDKGMTYQEVVNHLEVSYPTVLGWAKKYRSEGLSFLEDKPRPGRPVEYDGKDTAKVTALACSTPPKGYAKWSLRLLKDRLIELGIFEDISHTEIGIILKKTNFSLTEKSNGVSES